MPDSFTSEIEWVTQDMIQDIFNKCQYYEKVKKGELEHRIIGYNNHLSSRQRKKISEPWCTRSQMVLYSTLEGKPVVLVHQYRRKNGELGASGLPDPKKIFLPDRIIAVKQSD